ncbi:nucleoside monophosphate kinase [Candidatus Saccharibacteria bacterium]|nr:nucleoside monophosphate kinase [Candidatus Saccharibacteria bacterium]
MITLFGAPGAGKTEQGKLLAAKYHWGWVSYRDLLMNLRDRDIRFALEHGMFIDDAVAVKVLDAALADINRVSNKYKWRSRGVYPSQIILDGFPADFRQTKWMIENGKIKDLQGAIVLRVPRGELWKRLVARKRVDDTRAAIERRQDLYDRNITGMIRVLTMNGVLVREVDGNNSPQDVLARVEEVLADWNMIAPKQYEKIEKPKPSIFTNCF